MEDLRRPSGDWKTRDMIWTVVYKRSAKGLAASIIPHGEEARPRRLEPSVIASQRVRAKRRPMTGSAKQSRAERKPGLLRRFALAMTIFRTARGADKGARHRADRDSASHLHQPIYERAAAAASFRRATRRGTAGRTSGSTIRLHRPAGLTTSSRLRS